MIFIKKYWTTILLALILIFVLLFSQNKYNELTEKVIILDKKNKELVNKTKIYLEKIDSLSKIDTIIIKEIEYIKAKENEKIIYVDTMSVSNLQSYFSKRYN